MSPKDDAGAWAATVQEVGKRRELTYDAVGGLNPRGGPAALCPGGTNRLVGQLSEGFWGASCDADEREEGSLFKKTVIPHAVLAKAHVPDLAQAMPPFNVESLERSAEDVIERRATRNKVQFESIDFNKRFLATVPSEYDPIALREMFGPGFLSWVTTIDREVDFGVSEGQLYFHWRLARAHPRGVRGRARLRRRPLHPRLPRGRGARCPHLPARPMARGPGALPGRPSGLGGQTPLLFGTKRVVGGGELPRGGRDDSEGCWKSRPGWLARGGSRQGSGTGGGSDASRRGHGPGGNRRAFLRAVGDLCGRHRQADARRLTSGQSSG